ncbi:hypothetical protein GCM10009642_56130 [Nocardiopsis metallicus]
MPNTEATVSVSMNALPRSPPRTHVETHARGHRVMGAGFQMHRGSGAPRCGHGVTEAGGYSGRWLQRQGVTAAQGDKGTGRQRHAVRGQVCPDVRTQG